MRSQKKNVIVQVALLNFTVDLYSPKSSKDEDLVSVCPDCHTAEPKADGVKLDLNYTCPVDAKHGPFKYRSNEVMRAKKEGKALRVVARPDEIAEAKAPEGDKPAKGEATLFDLVPHYADEIEVDTYPVGTPYVLTPTMASPVFASFMAKIGHDGRIAGDRPTTLIGELVLSGKAKLFQLRTWNGQLVAQELCRPEELNEFEPPLQRIDERFESVIDKMLTSAIVPFDRDGYVDAARARIAALITTRLADGPDATVTPIKQNVAVPTSDDALLAMLEASVAAVEGSKAS